MLIKATDNLILNADIIHKVERDDQDTAISYADTDEDIKTVIIHDPLSDLWSQVERLAQAGIDFDSDIEF